MRATRVISLLLRKTNICIVLTVLDFFFFFCFPLSVWTGVSKRHRRYRANRPRVF